MKGQEQKRKETKNEEEKGGGESMQLHEDADVDTGELPKRTSKLTDKNSNQQPPRHLIDTSARFSCTHSVFVFLALCVWLGVGHPLRLLTDHHLCHLHGLLPACSRPPRHALLTPSHASRPTEVSSHDTKKRNTKNQRENQRRNKKSNERILVNCSGIREIPRHFGMLFDIVCEKVFKGGHNLVGQIWRLTEAESLAGVEFLESGTCKCVGTSWKRLEFDGNALIQLIESHGILWNLVESWGIFGLSDLAWSSNSEIMLETSRNMCCKSLEMSA